MAGSSLDETPFFAGVFGPANLPEMNVPFSGVDWTELVRSEAAPLSRDDVQRLKLAEEQPVDFLVQDLGDASFYVSTLMALLGSATSQPQVQMFALSRIRGILSTLPQERAALFLPLAGELDCSPFLRALRTGDAKVQANSAVSLALIIVMTDSNPSPLIGWICDTISEGRASSPQVRVAVMALVVLLRNSDARLVFAGRGGVRMLTNVLRMQGSDAATSQLLYELCFCMWCLTLDEDARTDFTVCGAVPTLAQQVAAAPREKIVRVALAALKNLTGTTNGFNQEMISCGLPKTLENMRTRPWSDADIGVDAEELRILLLRNYRELSTFEYYSQEVMSGQLKWGVLHTEKFWRETVREMEADDFFIIKQLIELLKSEDETVVAIACYDLGEFVRFYPNGKSIIRHLGAKDIVMNLVEHENKEVSRHALQAISKFLVNKWEFVKAF